MHLTDTQWSLVKPLIPPLPAGLGGRGRPWLENRPVLDGILYVLRTGIPWHLLPDEFPPYQTCHRRYQMWKRSGVIDAILKTLVQDLRDRGGLDVSRCFLDGTIQIVSVRQDRFELIVTPDLRGTWQLDIALLFLSNLQEEIRLQQSSQYSLKFKPPET
jgi:transposase